MVTLKQTPERPKKKKRKPEEGLGGSRGNSEDKGPEAVKSWVGSKKQTKNKE